jgi:hypothetical protein
VGGVPWFGSGQINMDSSLIAIRKASCQSSIESYVFFSSKEAGRTPKRGFLSFYAG